MIASILSVARREFVETVKTKTFIIGVLLTPVMIMGIVFLTSKMQAKTFSGPREDQTVAILNGSPDISAGLDSVFVLNNITNAQRRIVIETIPETAGDRERIIEEQKNRVRSDSLDAFLAIEPGVVEGSGRARLYTKSENDMVFPNRVQSLFNNAVVATRLQQNSISPEFYNKLSRWVQVEQIDLGGKAEGRRNEIAIMLTPFFFLFLMFFGIIGISQGLLMSVIEEKTSRVMEVLLASVSPFELMVGKILGQSAVGLSMIGLYGGMAYGALVYRGMESMVDVSLGGYFVVYYLLGYLVFASILTAIGSVCNDIKDAQGLLQPVMMVMIIPMVGWLYFSQHPNSAVAIALSFIPPIIPLIMIIRIASDPGLPIIQIVGSLAVLAASVPATMWAASKIFHTGVLMYGKTPSIREIIRWLWRK